MDPYLADPRQIGNGHRIPSLPGYCDQPYVVRLPDGVWLCVMTTGTVQEGLQGQRIVAVRLADRGCTWSPMIDIEPPDGREASWVMPFLTDFGRVYAFYTFNRDNQRFVITDPGYEQASGRVDTLGVYAYRWSDDGGVTWSAERGEIPLPLAEIDRRNPYGGEVRFFWGVGKPILHQGIMYFGFSRIGAFGHGFMATSEGALISSDNITSERNPTHLRFRVLPDGPMGMRAPRGPRAEETCVVGLQDGSLFCTMRGVDGYLMQGYSRDGGATFSTGYATYRPGGRRIKHPLACPPVWRLRDGRFLLWFHNHSGTWYEGRNPVWMCGGIERAGFIHWSQPEIVLYDLVGNDSVRISYPDMIEEDDGDIYLTETQKTVARVHAIPRSTIRRLFSQGEDGASGPSDAKVTLAGGQRMPWPGGRTWTESGLTLVFEVEMPRVAVSGPLLRWEHPQITVGVVATAHGSIGLAIPGASGSFARDQCVGPGRHRFAVILDARLRQAIAVVDGEVIDGGPEQQRGQIALHHLQVPLAAQAWVAASERVTTAQIFDRALSISEAVLLTRT
jgi:hypothetical protein